MRSSASAANTSPAMSMTNGAATEDTPMATVSVTDPNAPHVPHKKADKPPEDFLRKYLKAQNTYLDSIANDGVALLEYSHHLMQQQEYRKAAQVGHQCLDVYRRQKEEEERARRQQRQHRNWNGLQQDLYGPDAEAPFPEDGGLAQHVLPGLWYMEMHLANCYQQWGQPRIALYHIERTLSHLGYYQIDPDTLDVRLNANRKFRPLASYLIQSASPPPERAPTSNGMRFQFGMAAQSTFRRLRSNV